MPLLNGKCYVPQTLEPHTRISQSLGQHASLSKITGPHATGALSHVSELIGKPDCGTLPQAVVVKRGILLVVPVLEIRVTLGGS